MAYLITLTSITKLFIIFFYVNLQLNIEPLIKFPPKFVHGTYGTISR